MLKIVFNTSHQKYVYRLTRQFKNLKAQRKKFFTDDTILQTKNVKVLIKEYKKPNEIEKFLNQ